MIVKTSVGFGVSSYLVKHMDLEISDCPGNCFSLTGVLVCSNKSLFVLENILVGISGSRLGDKLVDVVFKNTRSVETCLSVSCYALLI